MPINGISGEFRALRLAKVRLGYKQKGKTYPTDTDVFVGRKEDGLTQQLLDAYEAKRIDDAEGDTWSLGKALRMLSYFEWDALHPTANSELVVNLLNRSWAHSKLRCSGTGGTDQPGEAICRDEAYKTAIAKATKVPVKARADGKSWAVQCLGPNCPMWHTNAETNKLAGCHRELRFLAQLLHPATDPEDPNYLKNLGSVEIVSGSFNGMIDVQSGLQLLRSVAGRSANIPFTLQRKPRTMLVDGKRLMKATLIVSFDNDEAIRFGYSDPKLSLVRPAVRKQLMAQKREQLELARMELSFDSVKDVQPQPDTLNSNEGLRKALPPGETVNDVNDSADETVTDRDEAVAKATDPDQATERPLTDKELARHLDNSERDELKKLAGGTPGKPETLEKLRSLARQAFEHFGEAYVDLSSIKVKHALFIRERLAEEAQSSDQRQQRIAPEVNVGPAAAETSAPPQPVQQELIP